MKGVVHCGACRSMSVTQEVKRLRDNALIRDGECPAARKVKVKEQYAREMLLGILLCAYQC